MSIPLSLVFSKGLWWLSYHVVVLYAVFQCLRPYVASRNASTGDRLWAALALGSLTIAWYHIYQFIYADFLELGEDLEGYLQHSDLFVNAYRKVTENQFGWFFSWQLLAWTCTVLFRMWEQGAVQLLDKEEEGHLAVTFDQPGPMERIWLTIAGFFGAMSTCGFFMFGRLQEKTSALKSNASIPAIAYLPTIAALGSVFMTPSISPSSPLYTWNLMALHVLLAIPILALILVPSHAQTTKTNGASGVDTFAVYFLLCICSLVYHVSTTFSLLRVSGWSLNGLISSLYSGFFSNHAQASIAFDMLGAMAVSILYMRKDEERKKTATFWTTNMLVGGPAVVLPAFLMIERAQQSGKKALQAAEAAKKDTPSRQERRRTAQEEQKKKAT